MGNSMTSKSAEKCIKCIQNCKDPECVYDCVSNCISDCANNNLNKRTILCNHPILTSRNKPTNEYGSMVSMFLKSKLQTEICSECMKFTNRKIKRYSKHIIICGNEKCNNY